MLQAEGYKMFRGTIKVTPKNTNIKPFELTGTWLYKSYTECWYGNGRSFPKDIVTIVEDTTK